MQLILSIPHVHIVSGATGKTNSTDLKFKTWIYLFISCVFLQCTLYR